MTDRLTTAVEDSASLSQAADAFLGEMRASIDAVLESYPDGFASDSHDGGTFMVPWSVYVRATGDRRPVEFMRRYRDGAKAHFENSGQWLDGYWRRQEAHHGPEHFDLFLRALWELDPRDGETVRQFDDAAEHIGNWKPGLPDWYDWERGVFLSFFLGTEHVGEGAPDVPEHLRFVSLALGAHEMTGTERYLDLARAYGARWADAILAGSDLPVALDEAGPLDRLGQGDAPYRSHAGAAPRDLSANLPRAENLLASGVPDVLLRLWKATGQDRFRAAAERVLDVAVSALDSPIAWQAHASVRRYRALTGSQRYDEPVLCLSEMHLPPVRELTIVPVVQRPPGGFAMGMRKDKPDWFDERGELAPSPLLWVLRAAVAEDDPLLRRAVDLGSAYFRLGRRAFGDTVHHGCGSRSLSAVARGHGRLGGAGVVTEVLAPALERLGRIC